MRRKQKRDSNRAAKLAIATALVNLVAALIKLLEELIE